MSNIQFISVSPSELADIIDKRFEPRFESLLQQLPSLHSKQKEFLSRKETKDFFGISMPCLHDWMKKGIVTPYKVGGRTYFKYSELVQTLLDSNKES